MPYREGKHDKTDKIRQKRMPKKKENHQFSFKYHLKILRQPHNS